MARWFGFRALLGICGALAALLAALGAVQYRWPARVAAADAQREKEHLESAATLFAGEFNGIAAQTVQFLENDAWAARQSHRRLASTPKLVAEIYYLDFSGRAGPRVERLGPDGFFAPAARPAWLNISRCGSFATSEPAMLAAPVYDAATFGDRAQAGSHIMMTFRWRQDRCFAARLDESYLRTTLFPQLVRQSFGDTAVREYDFAVIAPRHAQTPLYGAAVRPDLRKAFFSIPPTPELLAGALKPPRPGEAAILVQRVETVTAKGESAAPALFGPGVWELDIAHKGVPLAVAFDEARRRDLLLSMGVEALLIAAIVFLVIGARRIARLADQKMQFVAGVSHELRTPVSAIAMLSRNQADGLVTGAERVRQYGELIHQQTRRLNSMVEQTLEYAGIHSGLRRPANVRVDLGRLIEEAMAEQRDDLAREGIAVEIAISPELPAITGDARLLRIAFDNLLNNARKHAGSGRWIRVSAEYGAKEKEARISVEDHGSGIEPGDQAEIFEPFSRGRAAVEAQIPGSGLGLSLVRSAAETHHGSVTLVSEPGRGSTFTLHLPV